MLHLSLFCLPSNEIRGQMTFNNASYAHGGARARFSLARANQLIGRRSGDGALARTCHADKIKDDLLGVALLPRGLDRQDVET